jgi:hypothetical protein
MRRSALLLDSPNLGRSVRQFYGTDARPDYRGLIGIAKTFGALTRAEMLVNDGLPIHLVSRFRRSGYQVLFSHAHDCDDRLVARTVAAHHCSDTVIVGTGDGMIVHALALLKHAGKRVVSVGVLKATSRAVLQLADEFLEMPIYMVVPPTVPSRQPPQVVTAIAGSIHAELATVSDAVLECPVRQRENCTGGQAA